MSSTIISYLLMIAVLVNQLHLVSSTHDYPAVFLRAGRHGIVPCYNGWEEEEEDAPVSWFKEEDRELVLIAKEDTPGEEDTPGGEFSVAFDGALLIAVVARSHEGRYVCKGESPGGYISVEVKDDGQLQPVYLDRGQQATVPFFPAHYNQFWRAENDVVYWYISYGGTEPGCGDADPIASTFSQHGEGQFWVNDLDLVIAKVSADLGGYFCYKLMEPRNEVPPERISVKVVDDSQSQRVYLERGQPGTVPFLAPHIRDYRRGESDYVYWYYESADNLLASRSAEEDQWPTDRPTEGAVYIDDDWNLVIETVNDSDEGTYIRRVRPKMLFLRDRKISVTVKVSPKRPLPEVDGCSGTSEGPPTDCTVETPAGTSALNLTCVLRHAKPPADLAWYSLSGDGRAERVDQVSRRNKTTPLPGSTDPDRYRINNTYTSYSTIQIELNGSDGRRYACVASGVALGDQSGNNITVTIRRGTSDSVSSDEPPTTEKEPDPGQTSTVHWPLELAIGVFIAALVGIVFVIVLIRFWDLVKETRVYTMVKSGAERLNRRWRSKSVGADDNQDDSQ